MSIAIATPQKSTDPPVQVWAIAGAVGIGKTGWIFQQIEQISAPVVYFCPSAGNVPIDPTCLIAEFPHVQIFADGQELELIEKVEQGAIAFIELGFHLDLRSGDMLLDTLADCHACKRIALVPYRLLPVRRNHAPLSKSNQTIAPSGCLNYENLCNVLHSWQL